MPKVLVIHVHAVTTVFITPCITYELRIITYSEGKKKKKKKNKRYRKGKIKRGQARTKKNIPIWLAVEGRKKMKKRKVFLV